VSNVKVLVVDDSATMRAVIKTVLRSDAKIDVVGEAADAYEARALIKELNPDVITLDIEMPRMSGLDLLRAKGLLNIRQAGGRTLGQDAASCVVYGMPKSAFEIGAVEQQIPLSRIGNKILSLCEIKETVAS